MKQALVHELESGQLSLREAAARGHTTVSRVQLWLKEYGRYQPKHDIIEVVMKSEEERIAALEKALAEAHLKLLVQDKILELAGKKYKVDLKKTFGSVPSTPSAGKPPPASGSSAKP